MTRELLREPMILGAFGKCQQTWLDPADFTTKTCGVHTERMEGDRYVCEACFKRRLDYHRAMAEKMTCPECGSPLVMVKAKMMHRRRWYTRMEWLPA